MVHQSTKYDNSALKNIGVLIVSVLREGLLLFASAWSLYPAKLLSRARRRHTDRGYGIQHPGRHPFQTAFTQYHQFQDLKGR